MVENYIEDIIQDLSVPNHLHLPEKIVASPPMTLKEILADIEKTLPFNDKDVE